MEELLPLPANCEQLSFGENGFLEGDDFADAFARGPPGVPQKGTFKNFERDNSYIPFRRNIAPEDMPFFDYEKISYGCYLYYSKEKFDGYNFARCYLGVDVDDTENWKTKLGIPFSPEKEAQIFRSQFVLIVSPSSD